MMKKTIYSKEEKMSILQKVHGNVRQIEEQA
jgi:hypothetical protein